MPVTRFCIFFDTVRKTIKLYNQVTRHSSHQERPKHTNVNKSFHAITYLHTINATNKNRRGISPYLSLHRLTKSSIYTTIAADPRQSCPFSSPKSLVSYKIPFKDLPSTKGPHYSYSLFDWTRPGLLRCCSTKIESASMSLRLWRDRRHLGVDVG